MIEIKATTLRTIKLGHTGENDAVRVAFSLLPFQQTFPGGRPALLVKRPKDAEAYPVTLEVDGATAYWTVTDTDTETAGFGQAELQWYLGEVLAKSDKFDFTVVQALTQGGTPSDPQKTYYDDLLQKATAAQAAAENARDKAEGSADDAAAAATAAGRSASAAAADAKTAKSAASSAAQAAQAAGEAKDTAKQYAANAQKSAADAEAAKDGIEENDLNAEIAMKLLSEAGLLADRAENGAVCMEMLRKAEEDDYELILMDVQMPVMDGYTATQKIRKFENLKKANIPIIAMTANAFAEDRKRALDAGMNDYAAKPIDMNKLVPVLMKYLDGKRL